jgi:hypothetical protein
LRSLQHTKQVLYAARGLESAAPASTDGETLAVSAGASYEASLPRSGIDQLGVLFGIAGNPRPSGARSAGLILSSALYDERLGDHRRFGFPSDTSFVVGRSGVLMTVIDGRLDWSQYQARILGYRSLRIPLPESGASRWPLGWEIYADAEGDKARALASEIKLGWGVLAPLVARDELADHLVAAFGLAYEGYFPSGSPTAGHPQALALPLSIEGRAGLGSEVRHRSWIAARLRTEVIGVLLGDRSKLALETGAELQAHLPLFRRTGNAHDPAILVQGEILRTTLAFVSGGSAVTAGIGVGLELR